MSNEMLDVIRSANREFQKFIEQAAQVDGKATETRGAIQGLGKVDLTLKQVARYLAAASQPPAPDPEAAYHLLKYQENLKTLRRIIETLQFTLVAEKARLQKVRSHTRSAGAWATSLREIS